MVTGLFNGVDFNSFGCLNLSDDGKDCNRLIAFGKYVCYVDCHDISIKLQSSSSTNEYWLALGRITHILHRM